MTFAIRGLGTACPATQLCQEDSKKIAMALGCPSPEQATWLPNMYSQTGIQNRHIFFDREVIRDILEGTNKTQSIFLPRKDPGDKGPTTGQRMGHYRREAFPLALAAANKALEESGISPAQITHLVTVSCTGFHAPGVDVKLISSLHLSPEVQRTHVGYMGCHGALNGLRVARSFCEGQSDANVLLCAVELCSLHYHYGWDPQKMIANALFADGAAAVVGNYSSPGQGEEAWQVAASGSCVFPNSTKAMTWTVGDHGFEMTLSKQVPVLIQENLRPWLASWLKGMAMTLADIGSWAIHPGGPRILDAVEEALSLPKTATAISREILNFRGNMSSPTLLFILNALRNRLAKRPCLALGFGPGLTAEAALFV